MNRDFAEMLSALSEAGAEYLVVGGYAVIAHGYPRATGDIDIWVRPTPENAKRVMLALKRFGAPLADLTEQDLVTPGLIFQIGVVPNRIDILTEIDGVTFDEAWASRITARVEGQESTALGQGLCSGTRRRPGARRICSTQTGSKSLTNPPDDRPCFSAIHGRLCLLYGPTILDSAWMLSLAVLRSRLRRNKSSLKSGSSDCCE